MVLPRFLELEPRHQMQFNVIPGPSFLEESYLSTGCSYCILSHRVFISLRNYSSFSFVPFFMSSNRFWGRGSPSLHSGWHAELWHHSEFEFQSDYYIYFQTTTLGKDMNLFISHPHQLWIKSNRYLSSTACPFFFFFFSKYS